ncbi:MAG: metallophosphoesterase family protein [Gemmataceae bacterium]
MNALDRRRFLGQSLGYSAALAAGPILLRSARADEADDYQPDTLFLTWQRDPTTTMTVQWVGGDDGDGDPDDATIYASRVKTNEWFATPTTTRQFPLTDRKLYRSELTGLTPGTEYQFRIGASKVVHRFRTMPAKATNDLLFVSGGDCGVNSHALANNYVAAKQDPYFAIIGGDLAYDNGKLPKVTLGFLRQYSKSMIDSQDRLIPMVVCIGNHEVVGGFGKPRSHAPIFFALFDGLFADTSYGTLDFGNYLSLVLLDTGHVAKIGGAQASWLDRTLAARRDLPHLIVVNHVPAYPSYRAEVTDDGKGGTGDENRKFWVPLFEKHNVDVVLEHHDHTFKRTHPLKGGVADKDGILYLGDGSWGKIRAPKAPEKRGYLATANQSYHLTVHRLEGEQRFHMAVGETGKIIDVCMTGKKPRNRVVGA